LTIDEIIAKVSSERQIPGRFPSRLIFVQNFSDYIHLINELKLICDYVIDLSEFTKGDFLPRFKDLKNELTKHMGKQIILQSFGEYLRICVKRERDKLTSFFPAFWEEQQAENLTTKYIIPIFGGREIFDLILPIQDVRQENFIWEVYDSLPGSEYGLTIYSPDFVNVVTVDAENFHDWLKKWTLLFSDKTRNNFSLRTKLYHYAEEATYNGIRLNIIDDPFTYVTSLIVDGERLKKQYGNEEFWKYIAQNVKKGLKFAETIKYIFNIGHSFDPIGILARFNELSEVEQNLLFLWYKLYESDDYYSFAINKASKISEIPYLIRDAIFDSQNINTTFIQQRTAALRVLNVPYDDEYFSKLDKLFNPETRLKLLTYQTIAERSYAIKTVSELLKNGTDIVSIAELVKDYYPNLAEYLNPKMTTKITIREDIVQYFNWYRQSKIINRPNSDIPCLIDFDKINSRNKIIQQNDTGDSRFFWVDGLGVEWVPILSKKLERINSDFNIKIDIAKAILPTETEYNHQWIQNDQKWDRLDKLSHNGMIDDNDYFLCIARQFEIMDEIVAHIEELMKQNNRLIITSDHGSSRLAALCFHKIENFAIEPPENSIVRSFGRFVELKDNGYVSITPSMEKVELDGKKFIVMKTYEHFKQSGNAAGGNTDKNAVAGEIHGGMTPEEYLVPVIFVSRKTPISFEEKKEKSKGITINDDLMGLH